MKKISYFSIVLCLSVLTTLSCKKKTNDGTEPSSTTNTNTNTNTAPNITCRLASTSYSSTSYSYTDTYSLNANGLVASDVFSNSVSSTTTKNYTYTYDANGKVTKRDEGAGTYTTYEYTSGVISKYSYYASNTLSYYVTIEYQTGKTIIRYYNSSNQLTSLNEAVYSGDNVVSQTLTGYYLGSVSSVFQYSYSNYDDKYDYNNYDTTNPGLVKWSKNNARNSTTVLTIYNTNGTVSSTRNIAYSHVLIYNTSGLVTQRVTTETENSVSTSNTTTYTYTNCN